MSGLSRASGIACDGSIPASLLYRLASIYSPSGREEEAARLLVEWGLEHGLRAWRDAAGNTYLAPPRSEGYRVLLASHIDTVPGWISPGYDGVRVWGRGAVDAKGPLSAMSAAVLLASQLDPSLPVAVAALVGEEADSRGARYLVSEGRVPPLIIIGEPSGGERVIIGYRGSAKILVSCRGRGGHSSTPEHGDSALYKLLDTILSLRGGAPRVLGSQASIAVTRLEAGDAWNKLPEKAVAWVDARFEVGLRDTLLELVASAVESGGGGDCGFELVEETPPIRVRPQDPVPRTLVRSLLRVVGRRGLALKRGTSDMNILGPHASSIAAYGPGDPGLAHTSYEEVSVGELARATLVYVEAVLELARLREYPLASLPTG